MRANDCEPLIPVSEDFLTNPRSQRRPFIPVTWEFKVFDKKPDDALTDKELAAELGCSWQSVRIKRYKGHGVIQGWLLAGYLRQDPRSAGIAKHWLWRPLGA